MRSLLFILFLLPLGLFAQPGNMLVGNPNPNGIAQPETVRTVPQGVIKVRTPKRMPYIKCEYYLTCAHVTMGQKTVPSPDGFGDQIQPWPFFDTVRYARLDHIYPHKTVLFSKFLSDSEYIKGNEFSKGFSYSSDDTASIDTMLVEMRIGSNGKIRWKNPDTTYYGGMPRDLAIRIYLAMQGAEEWGEGGGYMTPKKFMRKQQRLGSDYYCLMYVIASAKPLTVEQRLTDDHFALFDIPLNTPPENEQQRNFLKANNIYYYDAEPERK